VEVGTAAASMSAGADYCTSILDQVSYCQSATLGFTTLPNTAQASCLCFNQNGKFNGTVWDNAASTCYQAMQSESQPASELSGYEKEVVGACTKFVDVRLLTSAGVETGTLPATARSTSKGGVPAKTTAGGTGSSSSGGPTAIAKSGAMSGWRECEILTAGLFASIWVSVVVRRYESYDLSLSFHIDVTGGL